MTQNTLFIVVVASMLFGCDMGMDDPDQANQVPESSLGDPETGANVAVDESGRLSVGPEARAGLRQQAYIVFNTASFSCIDSGGAYPYMGRCAEGFNNEWEIIPSQYGTFMLRATAQGLCLDGGNKIGTRTYLRECDSWDGGQLFYHTPELRLVNLADSGACLDSGGQFGARPYIAKCDDKDPSHEWLFEE